MRGISSQKPGTLSGSPMRVAGAQGLEPSPVAFPGTRAESWQIHLLSNKHSMKADDSEALVFLLTHGCDSIEFPVATLGMA